VIRASKTKTAIVYESSPEHADLMKQVPGVEWDKKNGVWKTPVDVVSWGAFKIVTKGVERRMTPSLREWDRDEWLKTIALEDIRSSSDAEVLYERGADLHPYQRVAVSFLVTAGSALLGDQMGLGKTVEAIATVRELELRGNIGEKPYLIVCPNSMRHTWAAEIERWYPEICTIVHVADGRELKDPIPGAFYITNWEKTWRREAIVKTEWDVVIGDESHRMKNRATKQTKAFKRIRAKHRYLLSGTPIRNEVTDLWTQLNWLAPERWTSYWKFFERYVEYRQGYFGREVVGIRNQEELTLRLNTCMIARTLDDVELELPELVGPKTISVELGSYQRKVYDQMRDEFVAWVEGADEALLASNWLVQSLRLKQISGSLGIFSEEHDDSAKLDALMELIEESPPEAKFVVMSQFKTMVDQTTARLRKHGVGYCEMTGDTAHAWLPAGGTHPAGDRNELVSWFQRSDKPKVFIATTKTGGEGITLTAANYFVFLDLMWTPGENEQAWRRIYRHGQDKTSFVYRLLAKDTIDFSAIVPTLRSKEDIINAIMRPDAP
jgi:SNF2 family DNA or RNA helicase